MRRNRFASVGLWATLYLLAACAVFRGRGNSGETYPLIVNNRTTFDVTIYAVPSQGSATLMRIGDARPNSTTSLIVGRNALQPQNILQVQVHAIGSARSVRSWRSPTEPLDSTLTAELDIRANPNGDLSRSSFYTQPRDLVKKP